MHTIPKLHPLRLYSPPFSKDTYILPSQPPPSIQLCGSILPLFCLWPFDATWLCIFKLHLWEESSPSPLCSLPPCPQKVGTQRERREETCADWRSGAGTSAIFLSYASLSSFLSFFPYLLPEAAFQTPLCSWPFQDGHGSVYLLLIFFWGVTILSSGIWWLWWLSGKCETPPAGKHRKRRLNLNFWGRNGSKGCVCQGFKWILGKNVSDLGKLGQDQWVPPFLWQRKVLPNKATAKSHSQEWQKEPCAVSTGPFPGHEPSLLEWHHSLSYLHCFESALLLLEQLLIVPWHWEDSPDAQHCWRLVPPTRYRDLT